MLFNATHAEETRVGIVDGQKLIDIDIEAAGREQRKSNIYKGIITRIEPSLEACFVDYGEERHGFLPFKEVSRTYFKPEVDVRTTSIREALVEGQELIVQVEKEERGNKGAALTTFISLAGRYLVLMPNNPRGGGVSRRIEGEERQELRETMEKLNVPSGMSTIARTAGIGRTPEELQWDLNYLLKLWDAITEAAEPRYEYTINEKGRSVTHYTTASQKNGRTLKRANPAPFLIVEESNLVIRAIRDYFHPDIGEILVDTDDIYDQARQFMAHVMPDMVNRVKRYREETPLFSRFQIEHQIETAYSRTVPLPSGGAIVIDHTEALVAVDVNSARATRGADIEETALKTNLEAADEVARQMRLRDLGGLIVIDFIDMNDPKNQRQIEQHLKEAIRPDRARVQTGRISRFGLMELSRQRLRPSLYEGSHITCPRCNGVGVIRDTESCALQVLRILQEEASKEGTGALHAQVPVDVATYILNEKRGEVAKIEARCRVPVVLIPNTSLETPHYHIERLRTDDERLDDDLASYKRAEDLAPVVDDPYAVKSAHEKPEQRPRQVPVIKNILPQDVAPVHEEKAKPSETKKQQGFFAKILSLFGIGSEKKKPAKTPKAKSDRGGKDRRRSAKSGEHRQRKSESKAVEATAAKQAAKEAFKEAARERIEERRSRRARKPRREETRTLEAVAAEQAAKEIEARETAAAAQVAVAQEPVAAAPVAETVEQKPCRERTRRKPRQEQPVEAAPDGKERQVAVVETASPQVTSVAASVVEAKPAPVAFTQEVKAPAQPAPEIPARDIAQEPSFDAIRAGAVSEEVPPVPAKRLAIEEDIAFYVLPESDGEPVIESESRRRRPRRRRRPTKNAETVSVIQDAAPVQIPALATEFAPQPATEPVQAAQVAAAAVVKSSAVESVEQSTETVTAQPAPAVEAPVSEAPEVKAQAAVEAPAEKHAQVEAAVARAQAVADIAVGLTENPRRVWLEQVETDASLVPPLSYEAKPVTGRPRPVLEAISEGSLEQVETDPKYKA